MDSVGFSVLLTGYKHIHMLNGYTFPTKKSTVFKYMPLERFVQSVDKGELVFVSPGAWYDPFEQRYWGIDCSSHGYNTEDIACLCVSEKSSTNEDASWRVYSDAKNKTVRLSIERDKLLSLLDGYATSEGLEVYIGNVDYSFEKKEIEKIYLPSSPYYSRYFPTVMTREHYLSLMLLKRGAFKYENEVRIFIVKDKLTFNNNLLRLRCDYYSSKLVSNVMLSPYPPVRAYGDLAVAVRERLNKMESDEIKRILNNKLGCRIQQSSLYKICSRIEKI